MPRIKSLFERGGHHDINLLNYLERFLKKGFKKKKEFNKYDIHLFYSESGDEYGYGYPNYGAVYFDTRYNFVLLDDGEPICSIGFNRRIIRRSVIFIKQIQGVRNKQEELSPLRWEKMLLQIVIDYAKQNKFKRIDVIRSVNHQDYFSDNKKRSQRMYMKYDITARRMGFKLNKRRRVHSFCL